MQPSHLNTAKNLSYIIALLALVAAAGGILLGSLYRDNAFVTAAWKANDWITLLVAIPALVAAVVFSMRGQQRAQLVWAGMLDYMLYNYAFYLFGARFNAFFLIYATLFALSMLALVFCLLSINAAAIHQHFHPRTPVRWISGYMLFVAIGLISVYTAQSTQFIVNGQLPALIQLTEHPTSVVFALDLSLLVPGLILGSIWLWQRRPWGYILAGMFLVKGTVYTLVLTVGSFAAARAGITSAASEAPLWIILTVAGGAFSLLFLSRLQTGVRTKV